MGRFWFSNLANDGTKYGAGEHAEVSITNGKCFEHQTLQVNYTSYDLQHEYDIINPTKHADIITPASILHCMHHTDLYHQIDGGSSTHVTKAYLRV